MRFSTVRLVLFDGSSSQREVTRFQTGDATKGKRVKYPIEVVEEKWFGWNCFLGWPVQGIWRNGGDGTDINSVDRNADQSLLVAR